MQNITLNDDLIGVQSLSPWQDNESRKNDNKNRKVKSFIKQQQLYLTKSQQSFKTHVQQNNANVSKDSKFVKMYEKNKEMFLKTRKFKNIGKLVEKSNDRFVYDFGPKASERLKISKKDFHSKQIIYNLDTLDFDKKEIIQNKLSNIIQENGQTINILPHRPSTASKNADKFFGKSTNNKKNIQKPREESERRHCTDNEKLNDVFPLHKQLKQLRYKSLTTQNHKNINKNVHNGKMSKISSMKNCEKALIEPKVLKLVSQQKKQLKINKKCFKKNQTVQMSSLYSTKRNIIKKTSQPNQDIFYLAP